MTNGIGNGNGEAGSTPEDPELTKLTIRSEEEAFALLQKALTNELTDQPYALQFDNWPILTLRFVGEGYNSTITPHIAEALIELQHAMNRKRPAIPS